MNIYVRVQGRAAQAQIAALEGQIKQLQRASNGGGAAAGGLTRALQPNALERYGSRLQWIGRQLEYNFTLPLVVAGAAATKFELDNERAMVGVTKVYGDGSAVFSQLTKTEIPALGRAFEALSNEFAVNRAQVIGIAADWAQAGASGLALAKSVKLTLETMILGEMNATEATQALIAIQAQYGQTVEQLSTTIDVLNQVENQTGITMQGLVQGFARAAGVARSAGVDVRHLAAFLAALTPAAGSAANAGNALKTIFSRLMAPTKDATQVMELMGIHVKSLTWQSMNGTQRLEEMAKKFHDLSGAQKLVVSSTVASRFQINRFDVLMRDIINTNGYYQKALKSTADATANYKQRQYELNTVLNSNPQKLKQIWTILQNALADTIQPLLPVIIYLASEVAKLATWFSNLNPAVQHLVTIMLLLLAAVGPVVRYFGALTTLFGAFKTIAEVAGTGAFFLFKNLALLVKLPFNLLMTGLGGLIGGLARFALMFKVPVIEGIRFMGFLAQLTTVFAVWGISMLRTAAAPLAALDTLFLGWAARMRTIVFTALAAIDTAFLTWARTVVAAPLVALAALDTAALTWAKSFFARIVAGLAALDTAALAWARSFYARIVASLVALDTAALTWVKTFFARIVAGLTALDTAALAWAGSFFSRISASLVALDTAALAWVKSFFARIVAGLAALDTVALAWGRSFFLRIGGALAALDTAALAFGRTFFLRVAAGFTALPMLLARIPALFIGIGPKIIFALRTIAANVRVLAFIIGDALTGPVGWAIAIAVGIFALFHRQLGQIWHSIVNVFQSGAFRPVADMFKSLVDFIERQFNRLPEGIRNAFLSVVHIVEDAAMQVYKLFQYLNPFAHHSPSLVENTHKGMQHVRSQHEKTAQSASTLYTKTSGDIQSFNKATGYLNTESRQFADKRDVVKKVDPAALASFDRLIADLVKLDALLAKQKAKVDAQQIVVDKWKASLDAANAALDVQQKKLESLQKTADGLDTALQKHQDALQNYAQTPITGMKAMGDAIFANDQAQKKLQLQLLQMEDVVGPIDKVQQKMANLAGDIEKLKGEQGSLRSAGAGSDITGAYDQQISQLQAQQATITQSLAPMTDLQNQLDKLQRQGEEMNLEQSLQFDPLTKQINDMTNSMKEMPFDQIIAGIQGEQDAIAKLQPQADAANKAVADQQVVVDQFTAARDKIQASYDLENAKLQKLQDQYQKTADMVNQVKDALNSMSDAAQRALDKKTAKLGQSASNFKDAAGGNFPDVGGTAKIGREGGLGDQSQLIDQWTKTETANIGKLFGSFDMFAPIKKKWHEFTDWFGKNVIPSLQPALDGIKSIGSSIWTALFGGDSKPKVMNRYQNALMDDLRSSTKPVAGIVGTIRNMIEPLVKWIERQVRLLGKLFGPDIKRALEGLTQGFEYAWKKLSPEIKPLMSLFKQIWEGVKRIWSVAKPILEIFAVFFIARIKMITGILSALIGPAFKLLVDTIKNALDLVIGIVRLFVDLFTGQWSHLGTALQEIVMALLKEIWDIFSEAFKALIAVVKAFVQSIIDFFIWLWDELVGHSIIPDMINAIVAWFLGMPGMILDALKTLGSDLLKLATDAMTALWDGAKAVWDLTIAWIKGLPQLALDGIKGLINLLGGLGKDAFNALWNAAKGVWEGAKGVAGWIGGLPAAAYNGIKDLISKLGSIGKDALNALWNGMKDVWNGAKGVWGWIGSLAGIANGLLNDVIGFFKNIGSDALNGLWSAMKGVWNGAKGVWGWISGIPGDIVGIFEGIGRKIGAKTAGMWDGIKEAFRGAIDWIIRGWNGLEFKIPGFSVGPVHFGGFTLGMPDIKELAAGGKTSGPALVGEGRAAYPEFVIPTDPQFRARAFMLYRDLGRSLGIEGDLLGAILGGSQKSLLAFASGGVVGTAAARATRSGGTLGPVTVNNRTEIHFHGDLEFPNVKSGDDAEEFIRNLEAVI